MKKVFTEVGTFDQKCYEDFLLSEDLLQEHAANSLKSCIGSCSSVMIVAGPGNNGADGIALARMLYGDIDEVNLYLPLGVKSKMAKLQLNRALAVGLTEVNELKECDVYVDALFGTGLKRELSSSLKEIIKQLNQHNGYKIACDVPTGIEDNGFVQNVAFCADITVTMGALKKLLFSDAAKDYVGEIKVANLGVSSRLYEGETECYLLEKSDIVLPFRDMQNTHKGNFGHLAVVAGKKQGAGVIAARAAYAFGAGLVTVVENEPYTVPYELMSSTTLPQKTTAVCIGMGLGNQYDDDYLKQFLFDHDNPLLIDADMFYRDFLVNLLQVHTNIVLTPHPKEFSSLLKILNIADVNVDEIQKDRFRYIKEFSKHYPEIVLLLKGANTLITYKGKIYIQTFGTSILSKGGSGDVLSGFIGALLAQGYEPIQAAITASVAHALSAEKYQYNNYSLTPEDIIQGVKSLNI